MSCSRSLSLCRVAGLSGVFILSAVFAASEAPPKTDRTQQVKDHLDAGEFGLVLDLAAEETNPTDKAALLSQIAAAQLEAGDLRSSTATVRRATRLFGKGAGNGSQSGRGAFGGGSGADFSSLMDLIQQNTSGPWSEGDGVGGSMSPFETGVRVAPDGVLRCLTNVEQSRILESLGIFARAADINLDVARPSDLRIVSLSRLERAVAARLEGGQPIPETMAQLAGLSQIRYVFVHPESNDLAIAGPAEGWQYNAKGQPVTISNGRPTLQLDDLVTVLRTFARGDADFGCSINTRDSGIRALTDYVAQSTSMQPAAVKGWVNQLQKKLGRQDVEIWGGPSDSRVARVIVEADYRMKLIGIDKLNLGKDIPSYFDLLPVAQQKNAQTVDALRWWLTMKYDGLTHSSSKNAFEIQGSSVLCQSENQMLTTDGKHLSTGQSGSTNRLFAETFTANYGKLAARDLVFADAQNIFDLALVSALIHHEKLDRKANWNLGSFAPSGEYIPARYAVPKEIDSVVNHRTYRGKDIVVQVAGGVRADLMSVVRDVDLRKQSTQLDEVLGSSVPREVPSRRWWWDVR